jgi:hypothetical protein
MWSDIAVLGYLHLHYLLLLFAGSDLGDVKALIILNLATIFVVDIMSLITTLSNKSNIRDSHFHSYIISIIV